MNPDGIAIVGMSGRFPGASDVATLWRNLKEGAESISRFPFEEVELESVKDAGNGDGRYVSARGMLQNVDRFDARFFGYLPREAELMDPQLRLFLELAWEAVEHAGHDTRRYPGPVGVFAGCFLNSYLLHNLCSDRAFLTRFVESLHSGALHTEFGNDNNYLATQVAYRLGLRGPAITIQTSCSTSLVGIATACHSLSSRECDMALAGGVTILLPQKRGYYFKESGILSPDGRCRPFDANSAGTVFSNGGAVLLLKRAADAQADGDTVYAVIRGYALNNDGSRKVNFTAPSAAGQAEVISRAMEMAGVSPRSIGYVEAHGTATQLGDPIEVEGLRAAYGSASQDTGYCALGSLKANIGHLDVAAGAAGLIKAALCVHEGVLPPQINYADPNPRIDFATSPFYVNTRLRPWPVEQSPRRAGVSCFGLGGTNAHVVIEQGHSLPSGEPSRPEQLILLSARSESALAAQAERLASHVEATPELPLADIAYTLQVGRREFDQRRFVVAGSREELVQRLRQAALPGESGPLAAHRPPIVFMFPGQGSQYPGMGRELYLGEPIFRETVDACAQALADDPEIGLDLLEFLLWKEEASGETEDDMARRMSDTRIAQPAIFAMEIALARLLLAWGIKPAALIGHSVGEFAAACLAGIFTLEDATRIVAQRGRLMQSMPPGRMLAVRASAERLAPMLPRELSIAAINAPELTVLGGPESRVQEFARALSQQGLQSSEVRTSHAFHSPTMAAAVAPLEAFIASCKRNASAIDIFSTARARVLTAEEAIDPTYWGQQLLEPVRFAETVTAATRGARRILLEVGPRQSLSTFSRQTLGDKALGILPCPGQEDGRTSEMERVMTTIGRLWICGVTPDWKAMQVGARARVALPTYPFERQRFWIEPEPVGDAITSRANGPITHEAVLGNAGADADSPDETGSTQELELVIRRQLAVMAEQIEALRSK